MFTWMWTRKFAKLAERVQDLEVVRDENVLSTDLSVQTLQIAPDFWQRQHEAFCYVNRKLQRMSHRTRLWGGAALLAVVADAALVVGGFAAFQIFQQHQASRQVQSINQNLTATPMQSVMDELYQIASNPSVDYYTRMRAQEMLYQIFGSMPPTSVALGTAATPLDRQLQSIYQVGQAQVVGAVQPLMQMLNNEQAVIRAAAAKALGTIGDTSAVPALHELMVKETDVTVQKEVVASLAQLASAATYP
ncbi:MAG: HEAT repeat domain-containing protein [Synechococcaceae cyanobacterium SM2_3_1]|nr:HEAT repeat domain-containing protein [Synechococcaceae cyanobacterium SM2_3_1]